jgi:serine/threonine-protein kinase
MEKERELLNELDSPYFPRLLHADVFSVDPETDERFKNHLFITVEERVGGQTLQDCRPMFARESACAGLVARLVDGLQLLWNHPQRIIHRDLKPENILIRSNGMPVIIDLGIVREEGTTGVTATHAPFGPCTPAYASPEQLKNQKRFISFKSDFFSLGVIAYELLAGENPFAQDPHEPIDLLVNRVLTLNPPTLFSLGRASRRFSCLIEKLMAKEPYMRPRTVADLSRELSAITSEM